MEVWKGHARVSPDSFQFKGPIDRKIKQVGK